MQTIYRIILLGIVLILAVLCYQIGFATGTYAVVGLGMVLELSVWLGLFKKIDDTINE